MFYMFVMDVISECDESGIVLCWLSISRSYYTYVLLSSFCFGIKFLQMQGALGKTVMLFVRGCAHYLCVSLCICI